MITIVNSPGVIDSDYRGEIMANLVNHGPFDSGLIKPGDRVAQIVFMPCLCPELEAAEFLSDTERGTSGFGSTGR